MDINPAHKMIATKFKRLNLTSDDVAKIVGAYMQEVRLCEPCEDKVRSTSGYIGETEKNLG